MSLMSTPVAAMSTYSQNIRATMGIIGTYSYTVLTHTRTHTYAHTYTHTHGHTTPYCTLLVLPERCNYFYQCNSYKIWELKTEYSPTSTETSIIRTSEPSKSAGQSTNVTHDINVLMRSRVHYSHHSLRSCE